MTEEPSNLILRLMREIRAKLDDHDKEFSRLNREFSEVKQRLGDMHETMCTGLGLAAHSNIRHDTARAEMEALKERIVRLEALEGRVQKLEEKV